MQLTHSLKAARFNPSGTYQVRNWCQVFAFKCNLYRYTAAFNPAMAAALQQNPQLAQQITSLAADPNALASMLNNPMVGRQASSWCPNPWNLKCDVSCRGFSNVRSSLLTLS
jgi:hypothetical protein